MPYMRVYCMKPISDLLFNSSRFKISKGELNVATRYPLKGVYKKRLQECFAAFLCVCVCLLQCLRLGVLGVEWCFQVQCERAEV